MFYSVDGDYTFDFGWELEDRDGEQFAKITDHKFDYDVGRAHYQLNDLFHGNRYLGNSYNSFIRLLCNILHNSFLLVNTNICVLYVFVTENI